jgi:hypothetical protein
MHDTKYNCNQKSNLVSWEEKAKSTLHVTIKRYVHMHVHVHSSAPSFLPNESGMI